MSEFIFFPAPSWHAARDFADLAGSGTLRLLFSVLACTLLQLTRNSFTRLLVHLNLHFVTASSSISRSTGIVGTKLVIQMSPKRSWVTANGQTAIQLTLLRPTRDELAHAGRWLV